MMLQCNMIFYIFRHGQTYFSKNHLQYGDKIRSAEILPEGIPQIKVIAEKLKKDGVKTIYSSPYKRCVQTVGIVKREIPDVRIIYRENFGEQKITTRLEGFKDMVNRIEKTLNEIKKKELDKVAICSHGWPIAVMIKLLKYKKVTRLSLINYPKCGELIIINIK